MSNLKIDRLKIRNIIVGGWLFFIFIATYLYFFNHDFLINKFSGVLASSLVLGCVIYLVLGCLRGFTLIPVTYLIIAGILVLPPVPLYILTIIGVVVSSASIYYFSEFLHLSEFFERRHKKEITKIKSVLQKNELSIIVAWSFFPFAPTDVICYVCGDLEVDIKKLLFGVLIGEGVSCWIYVFLGERILPFLRISF